MPPRATRQQKMDDVRVDGDSQPERFKHFFTCRVHKATRWIDSTVMTELGLEATMTRLFSRMGIPDFLTFRRPSYPALTSEFLSSFSWKPLKGNALGTLTFRLGNEDRSLRVAQLNEAFGFPTDCSLNSQLTSDLQNEFWWDLTGYSPYVAQDANARFIVHPGFRLAHRILANTIGGKDECGNVNISELTYLWCMAYNRNINLGFQLCGKFESLAKSNAGVIAIGGMITPIAEYFNIDLRRYTSITEEREINMSHLRSAGMISERKNVYYLKFAQTSNIQRLPSLSCVSLTDAPDDNWYEAWIQEPRPSKGTKIRVESSKGTKNKRGVRRAASPSSPRRVEPSDPSSSSVPTQDMKFRSLHKRMNKLASQISSLDQRFTSWEEKQQHLYMMVQQNYYHLHGHVFDPTAPFPPQPPQ